jgi:hypothetical protein
MVCGQGHSLRRLFFWRSRNMLLDKDLALHQETPREAQLKRGPAASAVVRKSQTGRWSAQQPSISVYTAERRPCGLNRSSGRRDVLFRAVVPTFGSTARPHASFRPACCNTLPILAGIADPVVIVARAGQGNAPCDKPAGEASLTE